MDYEVPSDSVPWKYEIHRKGKDTGYQINMKHADHRQRDIKCQLKEIPEEEDDDCYPDWWDESNENDQTKFVELNKDTERYKEIAQKFLKTAYNASAINIIKIESIQNHRLYLAYQSIKQAWLKSCFGGNEQLLHERELWHGTSEAVIEKIAVQGFKRDYGSVMAYGNGIYFARDVCYSQNARYAKPDDKGNQRMFLCQVVCGESCIGTKDYKRPPEKPNHKHQEYESMVDNIQNPSIVVIPNDFQAYPMFLITFK